MSDPIGQQLGQYQLTKLIHRGAMSAIYKAYQPSLERFVAVKVLFSDGDPQFAQRFKRSARMSASLQHPNILPTYDYGEQDNLLFLVLQYVEGDLTLDSLLGAPIELATAVPVMTRLLGALDYAHKRGIIHRAVKPTNIMMSARDWPLLGDFGIAKIRSDNQRFTSSGLTIGTPAYMAPEQATGRPVDIRTDLYAAGIIFYAMLTGRVPFDAQSPMDMLAKHVYEPPPSPRILNPDLPIAVEQVVMQALEKAPADRYQSAADMAQAIGALETEPAPPQPPSDLSRRYQAGADAFEHAPPQPHSDLSRLYQAGADAFESERWDAAIDLLSQLVARNPAHGDAANMLAAARAMRRRASRITARLADTTGQHAAEPGRQAGPTPQQPVAGAAALTCPRCGRVISSDWSACPYCRATLSRIGALQAPGALPAPSGANQPDERQVALAPAHTRGWLRRVGLPALLILLALSGAAVLVLARRVPAPASPTPALQAAPGHPTDAPTNVAPTPSPAPSPTPAARPTQAPTARPSASADSICQPAATALSCAIHTSASVPLFRGW